MTSNEIRQAFFDFFANKQHQIVASAPMVVKNDPTLMFTNAGMNQFKDLFLGNSPIKWPRIADSQKCLRVSGKHNDLEEVGHDTYHHTMFEMLGNWSFGDYFKAEAISWAWEFLTTVVKLDPQRMYATVFEGSTAENIEFDQEAFDYWSKFLPAERILKGNKKDNFWEMGDTGPCGPCSEIHVDLRDDDERKLLDGSDLVNKSHPLVIEIWNLVFIQFNRKANGELEKLPMKHVDTGMGFERLCMAVEGKKSNYDTGVFQPLIQRISGLSSIKYGENQQADIAMRVVSDHLRAIAFSIADGQLPSNVKAGYVIRRILRRAVRYGFTFLGQNEPFMNRMVAVLVESMGMAYPELIKQEVLITKVIAEEEASFLRTLETGIRKLDQSMDRLRQNASTTVEGAEAFELYDTYGFPLDLTELILRENGFEVDRQGFDREMEVQKNRSRAAAALETDDWNRISDEENDLFLGYDNLEVPVRIARWRKVKTKNSEMYQLVFNQTPFYAESGGQAGDSGLLVSTDEQIEIINTVKENNLIIHLSSKLPTFPDAEFTAIVDAEKRAATANNHSATHLIHYALRQVLGTHVEQKGSLVEAERLRFDFSHFQKLSDEEIASVEAIANQMVRKNLSCDEARNANMEDAVKQGAMALFGEKYGDTVRVIRFGPSVELCGGTHVSQTGLIGSIKIVSEGAIAAGIRRIEAITGEQASAFIHSKLNTLKDINVLLKNPKDPVSAVNGLLEENSRLQKVVELLQREKATMMKEQLKTRLKSSGPYNVLITEMDTNSDLVIKEIAYQLRNEVENLIFIAGARVEDKALLAVMFADSVVSELKLNAGLFIREIAKEINGGGGGQAFFATAGGKNPAGIQAALAKAKELIGKLISN